MRDPKRIRKILDLIERIWKRNPDLRLTQLIQNCFGTGDIYYFEDEDLERRLRAVYRDSV